jgi:hypothetical protein
MLQPLKNIRILILSFIVFLLGCGTLGGFDPRTFSAKRKDIEQAIDSLYTKYPEYRMPPKWKTYDFWDSAGYGFLETRMFYFKNSPEEMYWVSFLEFPDTTTTSISIRSVFDGSHWNNEGDTHRHEKNRIEARFDEEIISKLESFSHSHVVKDN